MDVAQMERAVLACLAAGPASLIELGNRLQVGRDGAKELATAVDGLASAGRIIERRDGRYTLAACEVLACTISALLASLQQM